LPNPAGSRQQWQNPSPLDKECNKIYNADGHAWFESMVGRGPATMSSKQMTTLFMKSDVKEKAVSIAVSIVEDDGPAREVLTDWIRHAHGFRCVSQHGSAESALMKLQAEKPSVVLMDINLPGMSGIECVRQLKPQLPNTQFVMLTVYEDTDHIFDALAVGASGYLLKQTPREELLTALKDVHAGGSPMTSNIARKVVQSFLRSAPQTDESVTLSPREREVLELLACGYLYKEIADKLGITVATVVTYIRRIYEKLHVRSRAQAVAKYGHFATKEERGRNPAAR
jgi:DNA-binding NarL/FixJ family response regulator